MKLHFTLMDFYRRPNYYTITLNGAYCMGCTHGGLMSGDLNTCNREGKKLHKPYPQCLDPKRGSSFWKKLR
jgi:hypothetical protein